MEHPYSVVIIAHVDLQLTVSQIAWALGYQERPTPNGPHTLDAQLGHAGGDGSVCSHLGAQFPATQEFVDRLSSPLDAMTDPWEDYGLTAEDVLNTLSVIEVDIKDRRTINPIDHYTEVRSSLGLVPLIPQDL